MKIARILNKLENDIKSSTLREGLKQARKVLTDDNKRFFLEWLSANQYDVKTSRAALSHLLATADHLSNNMQRAQAKKNIEALATQAIFCFEWLDDGIYKISPELLTDYVDMMHKAKFYLKQIDYLKSALLIEKHLGKLTKEEIESHLNTVERFKTLVLKEYKSLFFHKSLEIPSIALIESVIAQANKGLEALSADDSMTYSEDEFIPSGRTNFSALIIVDESDSERAETSLEEFMDDINETAVSPNIEEDSETESEDISSIVLVKYRPFANNSHTLWSSPQASIYPLQASRTKIECFLNASEKCLAKDSFVKKFTAMIADFFLYQRDATLKSRQFIKKHGKSFQPLLDNLKTSANAYHAIKNCLNGLQERLDLTDNADRFDEIIDNLVTYLMNKMRANKMIGDTTERFCDKFVAAYAEVTASRNSQHSLA